MAYFAAALARTPKGWLATELDLDEIDDFSALADMLREVDVGARFSLLFIEEDDLYLGIVRVDGTDDPRVFLSDVRAGEDSRIAAMLLDEIGTPEPAAFSVEEDVLIEPEAGDVVEDDVPEATDLRPAGDSDLLADLGTPAGDLLALCAHEGMLPADVITVVAERAGCIDELEEIRGG